MQRPLYALIAFLLLASGCSTTPTAPGSSNPADLLGHTWVLQKINGKPTEPMTHSRTTLRFTDSASFEGVAPVNRYGGVYRVPSGLLRFDSIKRTAMFSTGPDQVAEDEYFESLREVTRFQIQRDPTVEDILVLFYDTEGTLEYIAE